MQGDFFALLVLVVISNTIIAVAKNLLTAVDIGGVFDTGTGEMGIYAQNTGEYVLDRGNIVTAPSRVPNVILGQYNTQNTSGNKLFLNGLPSSVISNISQAYNVPFTGSLFEIGGRVDGFPARIFKGDIAEVIYYNRGISSLDQQKIQSYLAIKYGIHLDPISIPDYVASDGSVAWGASSNIGYTNTILGLGRDDNSGLNQKQTSSVANADVLTFAIASIESSNAANTAVFAADKSFLLIGNNGAATSTTTTSSLPTNPGTTTPIRMTLGRVWKVQLTGTLSPQVLRFDLTGAFSSSVGYSPSDVCLLIDRGNTGSFAGASAISGTLVQSATQIGGITSTIYEFSGIALSTSDRFTIGLVKKTQTLTFLQPSYVMAVGATQTITATVGSLTSAASVTYSIISTGGGSATVNAATGQVTATGAGLVTLIASSTATTDYTPASTSVTIAIGASNPILSLSAFGANSLTVDNSIRITASSNPATSTTQQTIVYSVIGGSGSATVDPLSGQITGTLAGTITFTATAVANTNYNQASTSTLITIGKSTPTISLSATAMVVGASQTVSASSNAIVVQQR